MRGGIFTLLALAVISALAGVDEGPGAQTMGPWHVARATSASHPSIHSHHASRPDLRADDPLDPLAEWDDETWSPADPDLWTADFFHRSTTSAECRGTVGTPERFLPPPHSSPPLRC